MTKPSGPPETARGRKGWKQKSNAKPNNLAMNLSPSCPKPHDTASASGNTLKERDAGCICCCQWKRVVVPFAINSCCRNAPLDIREANERPRRGESSLEEFLGSRTVNPFPAPATSHPACGFPALGAPVCFVSRVMWPIVLGRLSHLTIDGAGSC